MQVRRPCGVEENMDEGHCVVAYAEAEAIKSAEDKDDENGCKDTSNATQIGEWLPLLMVLLPEITIQEHRQRRAIGHNEFAQ